MGAEFNVLGWLFVAGQGLFGASLFYFLYLVIEEWCISPIILNGLLRSSRLRTDRPDAPNNRYLIME